MKKLETLREYVDEIEDNIKRISLFPEIHHEEKMKKLVEDLTISCYQVKSRINQIFNRSLYVSNGMTIIKSLAENMERTLTQFNDEYRDWYNRRDLEAYNIDERLDIITTAERQIKKTKEFIYQIIAKLI